MKYTMSERSDDSPSGQSLKPCQRTTSFQTPSPGMEAKRRPPSSASASDDDEIPSQTQSVSGDDDDAPLVTCRRQLMLTNPLLQLQAVEVDRDGLSVSGSENSFDDRDEPNLSCMTDGSYSDGASELNDVNFNFTVHAGDLDIYMASLGSQAADFGFGTPLHEQGRERFISSFDTSVVPMADASWRGKVCPAGHKCLQRRFIREAAHSCDICAAVIIAGTIGGRCKWCDYDICGDCFTSTAGDVIPHVQHLPLQIADIPASPNRSLPIQQPPVADVAILPVQMFSVFDMMGREHLPEVPVSVPSRPTGRLSLRRTGSTASTQTDSDPVLASVCIQTASVGIQTDVEPPLTLENIKALGLLTLDDMRKELWALLRS